MAVSVTMPTHRLCTLAATSHAPGYRIERDARCRLWRFNVDIEGHSLGVEKVTEAQWLAYQIGAWWQRPYAEVIGSPFRDAAGQMTQIVRIHPWRPTYWRHVWRRPQPWLSKLGLLARSCWEYR